MTTRIALHRGDITTFSADVIVNAANSSLLGGGGVDGAIHAAAGPGVLKEIQRIREANLTDGLPAGEAVATNAGNLPAKWIVHTVGPVWDSEEDRSATLASCYIESIELADKLGAMTVAFPAISTGVYRWPLVDAARIAIEALRSTDTHVELATVVLFSDEALAAFETALADSPNEDNSDD